MTVQIDIDPTLVARVDELVQKLRIDRTEYFRRLAEDDLVSRQYAEAYSKNPQTIEEVEEWEEVQYWEDE